MLKSLSKKKRRFFKRQLFFVTEDQDVVWSIDVCRLRWLSQHDTHLMTTWNYFHLTQCFDSSVCGKNRNCKQSCLAFSLSKK